MKTIDKEESDVKYTELLQVQNELAAVAKERLFSLSCEELKHNQHRVKLGLYLKSVHEHLMFYSDDELMLKLKEFNLTNSELRWFVSLKEIEQQFYSIEEKGIIIDKYSVLYYI